MQYAKKVRVFFSDTLFIGPHTKILVQGGRKKGKKKKKNLKIQNRRFAISVECTGKSKSDLAYTPNVPPRNSYTYNTLPR